MSTKNHPTLERSDIDRRKEAMTLLEPAITYFASLIKDSGPDPERLRQKLDQSSIDWEDTVPGDRKGLINHGNFVTELGATLNEPAYLYRSVYRPPTGAGDEGLIDGTKLGIHTNREGMTVLYCSVQDTTTWAEIKQADGTKSVSLSTRLGIWELEPSAARLLPL